MRDRLAKSNAGSDQQNVAIEPRSFARKAYRSRTVHEGEENQHNQDQREYGKLEGAGGRKFRKGEINTYKTAARTTPQQDLLGPATHHK